MSNTGTPRTLASVLLDIAWAERACARASSDDAWAVADEWLQALQDEARDMIALLTGVEWEHIEGANL